LEFLGVEKLMSFSLICRKQKLTRTVTLICWRLPHYRNVVDFIQTMTLNSCKTVRSHTAQSDATVSAIQNTPYFYIAADEWASYSPDMSPLDYCSYDLYINRGRYVHASVCRGKAARGEAALRATEDAALRARGLAKLRARGLASPRQSCAKPRAAKPRHMSQQSHAAFRV